MITPGDIAKFRRDCKGNADMLSDDEIAEMLKCENQRNRAIKNGDLYFDYVEQVWKNEKPAYYVSPLNT